MDHSPRARMMVGAATKIRESFWTMLQAESFQNITVRALVRSADINKNSFYYHYSGIDDLASDCIQEILPYELFSLILHRLFVSAGDMPVSPTSPVIDEPTFPKRFARLCLACGQHSAPALQTIVRRSLLDVWGDTFGIAMDNLGPNSRLAVNFLLGGIIGLLSYYDTLPEHPQPLPDTDFFTKISVALPPVIISTLRDEGMQLRNPRDGSILTA